MLTNLPFQNLNTVAVQFNLPISYVLLFFDSSGLVEYHRQRNISAHLIQKNWKRYNKFKGIYTYTFALYPEDYQPSGSVNVSRLSEVRIDWSFIPTPVTSF